MSLVAEDLKQAIVSEINLLTDEQKTEQSTVHGAVADAIVEYVTGNAEIDGTYAGTVSGNPDPLSGNYVWSIDSMTLTGAQLVTGSQTSFGAWVIAIETGLQSITVVGTDESGAVTTTAASTFSGLVLNLTQGDLANSDSFDTVWTVIAQKIIDSLGAVIPAPSSVSATSSGGGSGTVTWTGVR